MEKGSDGGKKLFILMLLAISLISSAVRANNPDSMPVTGLGCSIDYTYNEESEHDGGLYLSGRYGFVWIVSGFLSADAGYRFNDKSMCGRAGVSGMILFGGLEAGCIGALQRHDDSDTTDEGYVFVPGVYAGLNAVIPDDEYAVFLSAGVNLFFADREHELYLMATGLVNFE